MMSGNQQYNAVPGIARAFQRHIDCRPRAIQGHAVQVDDAIRLDRPAPQLAIPRAVERLSGAGRSRRRR
jgi:hypothetical protein